MSERPWETEWSFERDLQGGGQGLVSILVNKQDSSRLAVLKTIVPRWRNDSQAHERMRKEIDTLRKLHATNARVPEVFDSYLEHTDSEPFVLMSYIKGPRLDEWLTANAPASSNVAFAITNGVATTIAKCHEAKIGHRDLKPANIILKDDQIETPYVIDFGISFDSKQTVILTKMGEIFRNEFITLPECQDLTGAHRDLRSDITALAGLFFMCLTGRAPIVLRDAQGASPQKRHYDLVAKASSSPEQTERLMWFFDRAFAYQITDRFQVLDDFLAQLKPFGASGFFERLTLKDEINLLDKTLQARDRQVQIAALRRKYEKIKDTLSIEINNRLKPERASESHLQVVGLDLNSIRSLIPVVIGADLLEQNHVSTFAISRNHFHSSAVAMFLAFGVGMQIHIYAASYSAGAQLIATPHDKVEWSKIAVIDEDANGASQHTISLVVNDIESRLASEVRKLTRRASETK